MVGEGVQHAAAGGVAGDQRVILALIEVEPGLVAAAQRHQEPAGPVRDLDLLGVRARRRGQPAPLGLEALDAGGRRVVGPIDRAAREQPSERARDPAAQARHPQGLALDHADRPVAVHHEAGKPVRLAPAESIALAGEPGRLAELERAREPAVDQLGVDELVAPREEPAGDARAGVVEAAPEEPARGVEHGHGVARHPGPANVGDLPPVDPGVPRPEPAVAAALEDQLGRGATSSGAPPP